MKIIIYSILSFYAWFLNIIFPEKCLWCSRRGDILCDTCIGKIRLAERQTEDGINTLYDYRDPIIKQAIWALKYSRRRHLGEKLGHLLYESLIEECADMKQYSPGSPLYIVPVPISNSRQKKRGYNQAEVIAMHFCARGGKINFELKNNLVTKKVETVPQAKISNRAERFRNIKGVFEVKHKEIIRGRTIIIIDDVTTTGATIMEIIKILKKAGAKKVVGFTLAH